MLGEREGGWSLSCPRYCVLGEKFSDWWGEIHMRAMEGVPLDPKDLRSFVSVK